MKTLVQDEVQCENVTFFTARSLGVSWANRLGTSLDVPTDEGPTCNAKYPTDGTIRSDYLREENTNRLGPTNAIGPIGRRKQRWRKRYAT